MITSRWLCLIVIALIVSPLSAADLNKYLPDDTEIVVGVHVTALVESALVQQQVPALLKKYGPTLVKLAANGGGEKLDDAVVTNLNKILGDPDAVRQFLNDNKNAVRRVLIGTTEDIKDDNYFLVVEGDFNQDRLKAAFAGIAKVKPFGVVLKPVTEGKHEFYSIKVPGEEEESFLALADEKNLLCCSSKAALVKALERGTRDKPALRKELIEVADRIDPKTALWLVAAPKGMDEYVHAHVTVLVADSVKILGSLTTKDADSARNLADDLKGGVNDLLEQLADQAKAFPPLATVNDILKKVVPKAEKNVVFVEIEVPGATIQKMIQDAPMP